MKTIKSILIAATLISASVVSTLSAQQADAPAHKWSVAIGDSVRINRECVKYQTGEEPSAWVYDKVHTVRQLGTQRFPEGVLLMNILSWVSEEDLIPVNPNEEKEAPAEPAKQPKQPKQPQQPVKEAAPAPAPAPAAQQPKEEEPAPVVVPAPVPVPVEEAAANEPAAPSTEAVSEQAEAPQKAEEQVEQVKGDSIESQQNFKGGYQRFTIGLRGGASSLLHQVKLGNGLFGGDVMLDLQYGHYWTKEDRPVDLGIITGLSIGYAQSGMKAGVNSKGTVKDQDGLTIDYTIKADEVKESDAQIQLEIPLMFSLIHDNGLFFNVGPRFLLPVYTPYNQQISNNENTYINAYFQELGVDVTNKEITGKLAENQFKSNGTDNGNQFAFNLLLGAEIGYEWILKNGNSLGLGAYANYCVFSTFKNDKTSTAPLIQVTAPTNTSNAVVDVLSATKTYADKLGYFDAGVKLAYHFNYARKVKKSKLK